jgi:hypothetical protein
MVAATDDILGRRTRYVLKRIELRRSPTYWLCEVCRFLGYALGSVVLLPWLVVWPAVVVWAAWLMAGGSLAGAATLLTTDSPDVLAWIYLAGSFAQSLTIIGSRPYESELSRRMNAWEITYRADQERLRRGHPLRRGVS